MKKRIKVPIFLAALAINIVTADAQMKIGGTAGPADTNAYLQLGSTTNASKGLLLPGAGLNSKSSAAPLSGFTKAC